MKKIETIFLLVLFIGMTYGNIKLSTTSDQNKTNNTATMFTYYSSNRMNLKRHTDWLHKDRIPMDRPDTHYDRLANIDSDLESRTRRIREHIDMLRRRPSDEVNVDINRYVTELLDDNSVYGTYIRSPTPPSSGNWVIEDEVVVVENTTYIINGSILIMNNGTLILRNSTLYMNLTSNGEHWIKVYLGGNLTLINSTITAYNSSYSYYIAADPGSVLYVEGSNISYAGYAFGTNGNMTGLWIGTDNVTIKDSYIYSNYYGIYVYGAENITIENVVVNKTETPCGIVINRTSNVSLLNCKLYDCGILIDGINKNEFFSHNITSCQINGEPVYYIANQTNPAIPTDFGECIIVNSQNVSIENLNINKKAVAIEIAYTQTNISNVSFANNLYGIFIRLSDNITVSNSKFINCSNAINSRNTTIQVYHEVFNNSYIRLLNTTISLSNSEIIIVSQNGTDIVGAYIDSHSRIDINNTSININIDMQQATIFKIYRSIISIYELNINATANNDSVLKIIQINNSVEMMMEKISAWSLSYNGSYVVITDVSNMQSTLLVNNSAFNIYSKDYNSDTYISSLYLYNTDANILNSRFYIYSTGIPDKYGYGESIYTDSCNNIYIRNCSFDGLADKTSQYDSIFSYSTNNLTIENSTFWVRAYEGASWVTAWNSYETSTYVDDVALYADFYGYAPPDLYDTYYNSFFATVISLYYYPNANISNIKIEVLCRGFAFAIPIYDIYGSLKLENMTLNLKAYDDASILPLYEALVTAAISNVNINIVMTNSSYGYFSYGAYSTARDMKNMTANITLYDDACLIFMATLRDSIDTIDYMWLNATLYNMSYIYIFRPAKGDITIRHCWTTINTYDVATAYFIYTLISYKPEQDTYFGPSDVTVDKVHVKNTGTGWGTGITLFNYSTIVLNNSHIEGFREGIYIYNCSSCKISNTELIDPIISAVTLELCDNVTLTNNTITNSPFGIILDSSANITLDNNKLFGTGIILYGDSVEHFSTHTITTENKVNGNAVYYVANMGGYSVPITAGQVIIANSSNILVSGVDIPNTTVGVEVAYSIGVNVTNSKFGEDMIGLYLAYANNTTVTNNEFTQCGMFVLYSFNNTVENNFVNSYPLLYIENAVGLDITGEYGQVIIVNSKDITVKDLEIKNTTAGIELFATDNSTISNCAISNNTLYGISIIESTNCEVINNNITGTRTYCTGIFVANAIDCDIISNEISDLRRGIHIAYASKIDVLSNYVISCELRGVFIDQSNRTKIHENIVTENIYGIYIQKSRCSNIANNFVGYSLLTGLYVYMSPYNNITSNVLTENKFRGLTLYLSANSTVLKNNITYNGVPCLDAGDIYLYRSQRCRIYLNNFIGNYRHVIANSGEFDDGFIGNYWDNYVDIDSDSDGRWDNPYNVYDDEYDNYSLVNPVVSTPKFDEIIKTPLSDRSMRIQVKMSDPYGIESVILRYYNGSWAYLTMTYNSSSGYYEATIPPSDLGTNITVKIYARNVLNYWNMSIFRYEIKEDMWPPTFYEILRQPEHPADNESVTILVDVNDTSGISDVILSYNDGLKWINKTMIYDSATGYYNATIPAYPAGTQIFYKIYACDTYQNWAVSDTYNYTIIEENPPEILSVERSIETPLNTDTVKIFANITDENDVSEAILSYYNGTSWINVTMTYNISTGLYEATIPPYPAGTVIKYMIYAADVYENWATSDIYEYTIIELTPPTIYDVQRLIETPTDTDSVKIIVNATDDSGISEVILSYFDGNSWTNVTMSYNTESGYYEATIPPHKAGTTIRYKVYVSDIYDNYVISDEYEYTIIDLSPPTIFSVSRSIERPSDNDTVIIMANISDNSEISEVILCYYNGSDWINVSMIYNSTTAYYVATIPKLPAGTRVEYCVYAIDIYGNSAKSTTYHYTVIELNPPIIHNITRSIEEPTESDSVKILVSAEDDSAIADVILSYYEGHQWHNITMTYNNTTHLYEAIIPAYSAGTTIKYKVYVYDIYGNYAISDINSYTIRSTTTETTILIPQILSSIITATLVIGALIIITIALLLRKKKKQSIE